MSVPKRPDDELAFLSALVIAVPVSLSLWGLLIWAPLQWLG